MAIVTGASSGIGWEASLAFARSGYSVVVAARRAERLEALCAKCQALGVEALPRTTDVSHEQQVRDLVAAAMDRFGQVDVMVNNAGYGLEARVHETSTDQMRRIFETNYFGVFYGCRAVAPIMIRQESGHIFNVSSVIGKRGAPFHGAYCATKFALCGLTDAMRIELAEHNVRVTAVCPGLTATEFPDAVEGGYPHERTSFNRLRKRMAADVIARRIVATVGRRTPEVVFSVGGKALVLISALWPRLADRMMTAYYNDLTREDPGAEQDRTGGPT